MEQQTKRTLIIATSILIGATLLTFVVRGIINKGKIKREEENKKLIEEEIKGGGSPTQENVESEQSYNPAGDLKLIESYIVGANVFFVYPDEVNGIIMKLNNDALKKLAAAWKKKRNGESLYYWLDDELDNCWSGNCYKASMNRLSSLGLR